MTSLVDHFSPASYSLPPLGRSAAPFRLNAHLKVAPAQCVYGFYFLGFRTSEIRGTCRYAITSSDHHITPQNLYFI